MDKYRQFEDKNTEEALVLYEGLINEIIFHNEQTGYTVCSVLINGVSFPVVGKIFFAKPGEWIKFNAKWVKHAQYGEQLSIYNYEKVFPDTVKGMEEYLASGIIKGIGAKLARKIVKNFGVEAFDVIRFSPEKLSCIRGISVEKAMQISEEFDLRTQMNELLSFFNQHNIPSKLSAKVYNMYGTRSVDIIQANPYILTEDEFGIQFHVADAIAKELGVLEFSTNRIRAGIKYILQDSSNNGNVYMLKDKLLTVAFNLLKVPIDLIEEELVALRMAGVLFIEEGKDNFRVYSYRNHLSENITADKLIRLSQICYEVEEEAFSRSISEFEKMENISFAKTQIDALREAVKNSVIVITGGPGTGKTTIIKALLHLFQLSHSKVVLTAPTGRAAKRMSESTGVKASTIHRLLEFEYSEDIRDHNFARNARNPLAADVVVVDEMSMVDINIMAALVEAIAFPTRLILVGDMDQLPSVGPGSVLKDIIESKLIQTVRLNEVFRQAKVSMIVVNAHEINSGHFPRSNVKDSDFYFIKDSNPQNGLRTVLDLYNRRLPQFYGFDAIRDIQVITPTRKGLLGVLELNRELQQVINPKTSSIHERKYFDTVFRIGDRVMQTKNNYNIEWSYKKDLFKTVLSGKYDGTWKLHGTSENLKRNNLLGSRHFEAEDPLSQDDLIYLKKFNGAAQIDLIETGTGVFNGDTGIIADIKPGEDVITVVFDDDREVFYDMGNLDQLEHAYAITVHKSQGSEFPAVILPIYEGPRILYTRNLLYTAVTRAKSLVVIVGDEYRLKGMIENDLKSERLSSLKEKLEGMKNV